MQVYAGTLWKDGEARPESWIQAEGAKIVDQGQGHPPRAAQPAVLLDGVQNYHAHTGDAFLAGEKLPRNLAQLVAPETGLKHQRLAAADDATITAGIRQFLDRSAAVGVQAVVDFREQGVRGVQLARSAASEGRVRLHVLGRPSKPTASSGEIADLLSVAAGVGAPSLTDWGRDALADLSAAAHRQGRVFAAHASEAEAEPMEEILSLEPDLLVHLGAASRADLRLVVDAGVPVAVCPSSNEFFNVPCAAERLAALGAEWFLGTDNAMLGAHDPVDEARRLRGRHPELADDDLFHALTTPPEKPINALADDSSARERAARLRVLPLAASGGVRWDAMPMALERLS